MKTNRTKCVITAVVLFLVAANPTTETKAKQDIAQETTSSGVFTQNTTSGGIFKEPAPLDSGESSLMKETPPLSRSAPPGSGDAQKEAPIREGIWTLTGLAMAYGFFIFCRKKKNN